jgi:hypothetical protein
MTKISQVYSTDFQTIILKYPAALQRGFFINTAFLRKIQMQKGVYLALLLLAQYIFPEESYDVSLQDSVEGAYADYGSSEGITIYGDREKIERENEIIAALNKGQKERWEFIEEELLIKSGFRRTANVKFRNTTGGEKSVAALHYIFHAVSRDLLLGVLGIIPTKPFLEEEHDRLPKGEFIVFIQF